MQLKASTSQGKKMLQDTTAQQKEEERLRTLAMTEDQYAKYILNFFDKELQNLILKNILDYELTIREIDQTPQSKRGALHLLQYALAISFYELHQSQKPTVFGETNEFETKLISDAKDILERMKLKPHGVWLLAVEAKKHITTERRAAIKRKRCEEIEMYENEERLKKESELFERECESNTQMPPSPAY